MEHKSARLNAFLYIFVCVPKIDIYVRAQRPSVCVLRTVTHSITCPLAELLSIKRAVIIRKQTEKNPNKNTGKQATIINPLTRNTIIIPCDRIIQTFNVGPISGLNFQRDVGKENRLISARPGESLETRTAQDEG